MCGAPSAFNLPPPAPWVHVSTFSLEWKSTGSLLSDWHLWMLPRQTGHVGNVAGHHCQMTALSTCWSWSLQTESRNWHHPFSQSLSSSALPGSKCRMHLFSASLCLPWPPPAQSWKMAGGISDWGNILAYVIHPRPSARPSRTLLLRWRVTPSRGETNRFRTKKLGGTGRDQK